MKLHFTKKPSTAEIPQAKRSQLLEEIARNNEHLLEFINAEQDNHEFTIFLNYYMSIQKSYARFAEQCIAEKRTCVMIPSPLVYNFHETHREQYRDLIERSHEHIYSNLKTTLEKYGIILEENEEAAA